jgi:hypothetical protein
VGVDDEVDLGHEADGFAQAAMRTASFPGVLMVDIPAYDS